MELTSKQRVMMARKDLIMTQPFFGILAMNLKLVEDENALCPVSQKPTFCTDGEYLRYHPDAPSQYTNLEMKSVMAHEVMHLAAKHHTRLAGREPTDWNRACDYVINGMIKEANMIVPENWLQDDLFTGLSADEIYAKLHMDGPKSQPGNNGNTPGNQPISNPGQQQQNSMPGNVSLPTVTDDKGNPRKLNESDLKQEDQKWTQLVAQANMASELTCGNLPAGMKRMIDDMLEPKVDWRSVTREFVDRIMPNDYTFSRPNKRYAHTGFILPSLYSEKVGRIAVAIDSSGSVTQRQLTQFATEISSILEDVGPAEVAVFDVDTTLNHDHPTAYTSEDLPITLDIQGGGGTCFKPAFDYIKNNPDYEDPLCMIYLTDMGSSSYPDYTPDYPVLWVNISKHLYSTPPFGEIIYMNE